MRNSGDGLGIVLEAVEEPQVELVVDQSGARSLQLMAHSGGAPDVDVQIFIEGVHRPANRLAELVATIARRGRVRDHVDCEWYDLARPGSGLTAQERQGHRQTMIDVHLVDDRKVEILLYDRLRNVRGKLRMSFDDRYRPCTPPFVGGSETRDAYHRERLNVIAAQHRAIILAYQHS